MSFRLLRDFPWRWALWWVLVPNLAFIAMWPIGGPAMAVPMLLSGLLAIAVCHWTNRGVRAVAVVLIFVVNLLAYIAMSFNLGMEALLSSTQFVADLNPAESPEYIVAGLVLTLSLAAVIYCAPRVPALRTRDNKLIALGLVALLVNADAMATAGTNGSYVRSAPAGTPVDSAILQNHIAPSRLTARNLVVILVESWGDPSAPEDKAIFEQLWGASRWNARYDVTRGASLYYGSTTNAEIREWCAAWADYRTFDFDHSNCLPRQFRSAGFETVALHSFGGEMFDRHTWYPKIGFDKALFGDDLLHQGASRCGGVFPGACDRDVPKVIGNVLRDNPGQRKLVYWLTVNGHLPVPEDRTLGTDTCTLGSAQWRDSFPMLCSVYQVQRQIADSLAAEILKPDFPDADILIVGDHMPPFIPRHLRSRFDYAHVPWILLRSRGQAAAAGKSIPDPNSPSPRT